MTCRLSLCLPVCAAFLTLACDEGSPAGPGAAGIPPDVATFSTTLDFHRSTLVGDAVLIAAREGLTYSIDLDGDGQPEEEGPLGHGVRVTYRYDTPGHHVIRVQVEEGDQVWTARRVVTVEVPGTWRFVAGSGFSGRQAVLDVSGMEGLADAYATFPADGLVIGFRVGPFTEVWRAAVEFQVEESGAVALSPDGRTLYVDAGSEVVRLETAAPGAAVHVIDAPWGNSLEVLPGGDLLIGGGTAIARLDPVGDVRVVREYRFAGISGSAITADPAGQSVAILETRFENDELTSRVTLLDVANLAERWSAVLHDSHLDHAAAGFPQTGDRVYVLYRIRFVGWHLAVLDTADGSLVQRYFLLADDLTGGGSTIGTVARALDGRRVVFGTSEGAWIVNAVSHLPVGFIEGFEGLGCCNATAGGESGNVLFASGSAISKVHLSE